MNKEVDNTKGSRAKDERSPCPLMGSVCWLKKSRSNQSLSLTLCEVQAIVNTVFVTSHQRQSKWPQGKTDSVGKSKKTA